MRKQLNKRISLVFAAALCACGLQACWIDSNNCEYRTECSPILEEVCGWYEYCDSWGYCVDEWRCDYHQNCSTVCVEPQEGCLRDSECGPDAACRNGMCIAYNDRTPDQGQPSDPNKRGDVSLCGTCSKSADCYEENAACTALESGEQVCTRTCNTANDCPLGFTCSVVTDNSTNTSVNQCLPANGSCNNSYCLRSSDCPENGTCENGSCVLGTNNLSECENYQDCAQYKTQTDNVAMNTCVFYNDNNGQKANYCTINCYGDYHCDPGYTCYLTKNDLDSGVCFRGSDMGCFNDKDCDSGMVCSDGRCAVSCTRDSECKSSNGNFRCVRNICVNQY